MTTHVLISPLGRSPGAVSGLYYALRDRTEEPVEVTEVITVGTSDRWVQAAARVLEELFKYERTQGHQPTYRAEHITATDLRGVERDIGPFVARLGRRIEQARNAGFIVHVGVTGGRSGMGALAALAAQLYGASHLYHLWVDEEIEKKGQMGQDLPRMGAHPSNPLLKPRLKRDEPDLAADEYELVGLPFFDLSPLHEVIRRYLTKKEVPDVNSPLYPLFVTHGMGRLRQVFPAPLTIAQADRLLEVAAEWFRLKKRLDAAEPLRPSDQTAYLTEKRAVEKARHQILLEVGRILQDAEITDASTSTQVVELVRSGGDWSELLALTEKAKQDGAGWLQWFRKNKDGITTALAVAGTGINAGTFLLKALELWLKAQGYV
jgi:hypothetical protein